MRASDIASGVDWGQPIRWSHPLTRGLVSWWKAVPGRMGYGSNQWRDMVHKSRNHGTMTNGARHAGTMRTGGAGSALFDGTNDYCVVADHATLDLTGQMTVALWARSNSSNIGNTFAYLIDKSDDSVEGYGGRTGAGGFYVMLENRNSVSATQALEFEVGTTNNSLNQYATNFFTDTNWHHGIVTWNDTGESMAIYKDGAAQSLSTRAHVGTAVLTASADNMIIGAGGVGDLNFFAGLIDDIMLFNRALTATDARRLWQFTSQRMNPMLNWIEPQVYGFSVAAVATTDHFLGLLGVGV